MLDGWGGQRKLLMMSFWPQLRAVKELDYSAVLIRWMNLFHVKISYN